VCTNLTTNSDFCCCTNEAVLFNKNKALAKKETLIS
jgi:hypothetical protein